MMAGLSCEGLAHTAHSWFLEAACRGMDVDLFFIAPGETPTEALKTCAVCTVQKQCLDYAEKNGISQGIWGATTPRRRRSGRPSGYEPFLSPEARRQVLWLDKNGWTDVDIAREYGVTSRTVQRVLARERAK